MRNLSFWLRALTIVNSSEFFIFDMYKVKISAQSSQQNYDMSYTYSVEAIIPESKNQKPRRKKLIRTFEIKTEKLWTNCISKINCNPQFSSLMSNVKFGQRI